MPLKQQTSHFLSISSRLRLWICTCSTCLCLRGCIWEGKGKRAMQWWYVKKNLVWFLSKGCKLKRGLNEPHLLYELTGKFLLSSLRSCHTLTNRSRLRWSSSRWTDTFLFLLASSRSHSSSTSLKLSITMAKACTDRYHSTERLAYQHVTSNTDIFLISPYPLHMQDTPTHTPTIVAFLMNSLTRSFIPAALLSDRK